MTKRDSKPEPRPHALRLRRERLQTLLFRGAAIGAAIVMAGGAGGDSKWPYSAGE